MDVGVITALLQYGGFGILALFFLWDKKESNKRYDQLLKQNADNQAKMLEIEKQNSENMAELKNNLKYNMMCPLIQKTAYGKTETPQNGRCKCRDEIAAQQTKLRGGN